MKKFVALLVLVFGVLVGLSAVASDDPPPSVEAPRSFVHTLHVDVDFTAEQRAAIVLAAARWREFTRGRVDLRVVFDVDFREPENLRDHYERRHTVVLEVRSDFPVVQRFDEEFGDDKTVLAITARGRERMAVYLIVDRIDPSKFRQVVQHEFGHVAGFGDLPVKGSIMSGAASPREKPVLEFTPLDREFCRAERYCD